MYKSPIEIIQSDIQMKTEECILKAVQKIGVNIDKDELIKAIMYDRKQYEKGYADGIAAAQRWIPCGEGLPDRFGKILVTFIPAAGALWTQVIIANYSDLMGIAKPCFWIGNVGKNDFANITSQVVAWMPLPEPYRQVKSG